MTKHAKICDARPFPLSVLGVMLNIALAGAALASQADMTAQNILDAMLAAEQQRPPVAMDLTIHYSYPRDGKTVANWYKSKFRLDGKRIDVIVDTHYSANAVSPDQITHRKRVIWDGLTYLERYHNLAAGDPGYIAGTGKLAPVPPIRQKQWAAPWADGIVRGDYRTAAQVIADSGNATLAPEMEKIDGFDTYLVESRNEHGHYKLWVDPNNGFLARKIVVARDKGDIHWGKPLVDETFHMQISGVEIKRIAGRCVVTRSTIRETGWRDGSIVQDYTYTVARDQIRWNPDFAKMGAFVMDGVPEGAVISHWDFPGIRYVWADGRPVVDADLPVVEQIDNVIAAEKTRPPFPTNLTSDANHQGQSPRPQPNTPPQQLPVAAPSRDGPALTWLLLGAAAAAAAVLALLLISQRAAGRSRQNS